MKRIGIITIQKCGNFGADLQAYALGAKLRSMGHDAENIDYLFYKHPRHLKGPDEKPALNISLVNRIKENVAPVISKIKKCFHSCGTDKSQIRRFDEWFAKNVKVGKEYRSVHSLYVDPPSFDVYMVGSDQVWNPRTYSNIKPYFLDFVPSGARRVSYASSFGVDELPGEVFLRYKQWLKTFAAIGVREQKGAAIVKAMGLKAEVSHVLDPTLLLSADDWSRVSIPPEDAPESGKYVLLYELVASNGAGALAQRWAAERGLSVVRIGATHGPGEFLWLFANAAAVVTTSFHGTVFSILNRKPFFSIVPSKMTNSDRQRSLLVSLGIPDRLINDCNCGIVETGKRIDFEHVAMRLGKMRAASLDFLSRSIEGKESTSDSQSIPRACFAVWNKDNETRAASTSGGVFSVLAETMIARGGIVIGAAWDADFKHVHHVVARAIDELAPLRQSKYVYSDARDSLLEMTTALQAGIPVLFSGTPCQCASARAAAKVNGDLLLTIDFVCHGTPRTDVFATYADELEKHLGGHLSRYEFRNKDKGWNFQNVVYTIGKRTYRVLPWLDPYFHGFSVNAFLRDSCYVCPFAKLERSSDFTMADCWRVATSNPEYDDDRGTSLLLVNSIAAAKFWEEIHGAEKVFGGEYDLDLAQARNMALMHPPTKPACHDKFFEVFNETGSFSSAANCYLSWKKTLKYFILYHVKRIGWRYFRRHQ